jgi:hypothetical protein
MVQVYGTNVPSFLFDVDSAPTELGGCVLESIKAVIWLVLWSVGNRLASGRELREPKSIQEFQPMEHCPLPGSQHENP